MKTMVMTRTFYYRPRARAVIKYVEGRIYERVPEAAVSAIVKAAAGAIRADVSHDA